MGQPISKLTNGALVGQASPLSQQGDRLGDANSKQTKLLPCSQDRKPKGYGSIPRQKKQAETGDAHLRVHKRYHVSLIMMAEKNIDIRYGATPLESRQGGKVPGSTRKSPPKRLGGTSTTSCGVGRLDQRENAAGQQSKNSAVKLINVLQWNSEGIYKKKDALKHVFYREDIDVVCLQETHLNSNMRFNIRGYQVFRRDRVSAHKGGIVILVKNNIPAEELPINNSEESEINAVKLILQDRQLVIFNVYAPPDKSLYIQELEIPTTDCMVVGDFNSHSPSWGYTDLDAKGEEIEDWQVNNCLQLLNKPDDIPTFYSRAWKTTSHPDLSFVSNNLSLGAKKEVMDQLANSDHKPIKISLDIPTPCYETNTMPRWNYKKANWELFARLTDNYTININTKSNRVNQSSTEFTSAVLKAAKEAIPRGARKEYIPNWSEQLQQLNEELTHARKIAEEAPTTENNTNFKKAAALYTRETNAAIRKGWHEKTASLNFEKDGNKLWKLVGALSGEHDTKGAPICLEDNGTIHTGKEAANILLKQYKDVGQLNIPQERREANFS